MIVILLGSMLSCQESNTQATHQEEIVDLPTGSFEDQERVKADGTQNWGSALNCKEVPELSPLKNPTITLSIHGLTLELKDETTGFYKVYPVGPGAIDTDEASPTFGESFSYAPILEKKSNHFKITPNTIQPCKTWLASANAPVFAGLPFLSFHGNYAIHGPIDNFRAENGGSLRRGFVSHGCFRMEAADILEVYALIKGVAEVPVSLYREPQINEKGQRVDIEEKWIGSECQQDSDCGFDNAICALNPYSNMGFCSLNCDGYCPDKARLPVSACVPNQNGDGGICVLRAQSENDSCRNQTQFIATEVELWHRDGKSAQVCVPGTNGFIGDACFGESDCTEHLTCLKKAGREKGICTQPCDRFCSDHIAKPLTACVALSGEFEGISLDQEGYCVRQCDLHANLCQNDEQCSSTQKINRNIDIFACLPE